MHKERKKEKFIYFFIIIFCILFNDEKLYILCSQRNVYIMFNTSQNTSKRENKIYICYVLCCEFNESFSVLAFFRSSLSYSIFLLHSKIVVWWNLCQANQSEFVLSRTSGSWCFGGKVLKSVDTRVLFLVNIYVKQFRNERFVNFWKIMILLSATLYHLSWKLCPLTGFKSIRLSCYYFTFNNQVLF